MNERIQELARQAEFSEKDLHIQGDNFQKFAELIINDINFNFWRVIINFCDHYYNEKQ